MSPLVFTLFLWLAATVAHFWLTALAVTAFLRREQASLDEQIFAAVLTGVATMSLVLHIVALTVGIGLWSGVLALAVGHAGVRAIVQAQRRRTGAAGGFATPTVSEKVAIAVLFGVVLSWITAAALAMESGSAK